MAVPKHLLTEFGIHVTSNEVCPFPHSLRFCHNWLAQEGVPGVRYADKLSELFNLHWERFWLGVYGVNMKLLLLQGCAR